MKVAETFFAKAIYGLQDAISERPEGMAVRLGCSYGTYIQWLRGERDPSGEWLIKMLRLCPDKESLEAFGIDLRILNMESRIVTGKGKPGQYYNDAVIGLKLLMEAADSGSSAAAQLLKDLADRASRAGAKFKKL